MGGGLGFQVSDFRKLRAAGREVSVPTHPPGSRRVSLTGQLCPLGPWVVDAMQREAPQPLVQQLPVPDPEAQEDAVDLVLCRWLQGGVGNGEGLASPQLSLPPFCSPPTPPSGATEQKKESK